MFNICKESVLKYVIPCRVWDEVKCFTKPRKAVNREMASVQWLISSLENRHGATKTDCSALKPDPPLLICFSSLLLFFCLNLLKSACPFSSSCENISYNFKITLKWFILRILMLWIRKRNRYFGFWVILRQGKKLMESSLCTELCIYLLHGLRKTPELKALY